MLAIQPYGVSWDGKSTRGCPTAIRHAHSYEGRKRVALIDIPEEPEVPEQRKRPSGSGIKRGTELGVVSKAKELSSYILTVTAKSPKRFRFTLTSRLQNYSLDVIEKLYLANEVFVGKNEALREKRLALQHEALTRLKMLTYIAQLAMEQEGILYKQYQQIARLAYDCQNMLGAWINSDRRRFGSK